MDIFGDDTEFTDIRMVQKVVNMFDGRPHMQRIITCGLFGMEYSEELDDTGEDDFDHWAHGSFHGYGRLPGRSNDRGLNRNPMSSSVYPPPLHYYASAHEASQPAVKVNSRDNDTERKTRLLQESKKGKNKAEKKRLKKQKQKERKQREKLEKDKKQNPARDEEDKDDAQQPEAEDGGAAADKYEDDTGSGVKLSASAKDTDTSDSSENESSDEDAKNDSNDSEELDMTSTFVSKAALIAKRKLEQKPRAEKKEKKKTPGKEERKAVADKPTQDEEVDKKDSAALSSSAFEENVKISTNLANIGNKYASSGDFNMAVKYFTDAIKYNPTEFKLFGNRSFCFEKLREYDKALTDAELSLGICPGWVKGLFRKGRALAGLKRYEEAAQAFRTVLKMDSSCAEAAQELMRVQITQLMGFGFTREQSSNALIIHGTVEKSLEVLSTLNGRPGVTQNGAVPPAQVVNVSGVSPVLSANTSPAAAAARYQEAPKQKLINKPLAPVQNMSNVPNQPKPVYTPSMKASDDDGRPPPELFPVWIGNLNYPVPESTIVNLFSKVGVVYSAKVLVTKRCAFVNFTKQEDCDEAIHRFHGYELNGMKIAVRYPDRIPPGMGISRSALRAENPQDENVGNRELDDGRNAVGNRRFVRPYKPVQNHRGNY
ncbi:nucleolin-like isoform X2 [Stegastes partitus]|uniref:Nucleolin-like n=1 Tax=Stegastes partitus TaxID=144197 RepID=A0A3B4ZCP9_9TELE|nr:PREDICTED: nucleolin-like isoform X2 [Stegastes partitus]